MAVFSFDALKHDPIGTTVKFPEGTYTFEIVKAELKPVKDNPNSGYLELTYRCMEGPMEGNTQAHRFNLYHEKADVSQIARRQLSSVCHVIGQPVINDTDDYVGGRLKALVGPQERDTKYSDVKKVFDLDGNEAVAGQPYGGGRAGRAAAASAHPWATKPVVEQNNAVPEKAPWA